MSPVTFPSDMSGAHHTHHTADISSNTRHTETLKTNSEIKKRPLPSQGKARKAAVTISESDHDELMSGCRNNSSYELIKLNKMETLLFVASDSQIIYFWS